MALEGQAQAAFQIQSSPAPEPCHQKPGLAMSRHVPTLPSQGCGCHASVSSEWPGGTHSVHPPTEGPSWLPTLPSSPKVHKGRR